MDFSIKISWNFVKISYKSLFKMWNLRKKINFEGMDFKIEIYIIFNLSIRYIHTENKILFLFLLDNKNSMNKMIFHNKIYIYKNHPKTLACLIKLLL